MSDDMTTLTSVPLAAIDTPLKLAISRYPLTSIVQQTDIKTAHRDFYDGERERIGTLVGADEVLFLDAEGQLKEGSFTSLFIQDGDRLLTPRGPGLLPGILRAELLDTGQAVEANISLDDLSTADAVFMGNSLRGLMPAILLSPEPI
jgi:para-aminobenzoate synthetase/4-amino-4-deoxychorismate lyase